MPALDSFGLSMLFANELLKKGETEVVLESFEDLDRGSDRLDAWGKAVKAGVKPDFGNNLIR